MDTNWHKEFTPHILARGKDYFEEGCVSNIVQHMNKITATVSGTQDYFVEIDLPGGVPDKWSCSCPYAAHGNCKHKAAVLFAVEAGDYVFTDDSTRLEEDDVDKEPSLPWCDAIEQLSFDRLQDFLWHYADLSNPFREHLSIWYLRGLPEGLLEQWEADLLRYASMVANESRYIPEQATFYFMREVRQTLNNRLLLLQRVGAVMDAFYWLGVVFEIAAKKIHTDADGELEIFFYDCWEDWSFLIEGASEAQQEQMYKWFWDHRAAFFAHPAKTPFSTLFHLPWSDVLDEKTPKIIDDLIVHCHNSKEMELLIDCRVEAMRLLDYPKEEIWSFWQQHLIHDHARYCLLQDYYSNPENHEHIIPLLMHLKELDKDDLPRLIQDSVWLAKMYQENGSDEEYNAERSLLLTQYRHALTAELPEILSKKAARRFISCLNALHSLKDAEVEQMIGTLVASLCSNPAIARKGIIEMVNGAGYEWPKPYRFSE